MTEETGFRRDGSGETSRPRSSSHPTRVGIHGVEVGSYPGHGWSPTQTTFTWSVEVHLSSGFLGCRLHGSHSLYPPRGTVEDGPGSLPRHRLETVGVLKLYPGGRRGLRPPEPVPTPTDGPTSRTPPPPSRVKWECSQNVFKGLCHRTLPVGRDGRGTTTLDGRVGTEYRCNLPGPVGLEWRSSSKEEVPPRVHS